MTLDRLRQMFDYELWANRRTLESLRNAAGADHGPRWFAHILAGQRVWLTRLDGRDSSSIEVWPERPLEACADELERQAEQLNSYLGGLDEASLLRQVRYRTHDGREYRNTPLDILTHLGLHSQHHRGQIAAELRRLGQQPAVIDFIAHLRV